MKKTVEKKRRTITIDITEWYDKLKEISQREIRSIEEQCKFFIKNGIDGNNTTTITYIENPHPSISTWPSTWPSTNPPLWTCEAGKTNVTNPFNDDTVMYCNTNCGNSSTTASNRSESEVDCELNKKTGCFEAKE